MSKIFKAIMLFVLLIVLPAGSWFYLRGGLNWRKTALSELQQYGKIRAVYNILPDGTQVDLLQNKVCVVHNFGSRPDLTPENQQVLSVAQDLAKRFAENGSFRNVLISEDMQPALKAYRDSIPGLREDVWVFAGGLGGWRTILENQYEYFYLHEKTQPVKHYFALTDTSGTIRRFYDATDQKQVARMIEHVAILLPQHQGN